MYLHVFIKLFNLLLSKLEIILITHENILKVYNANFDIFSGLAILIAYFLVSAFFRAYLMITDGYI
jgi:hypothetical protein